MEIHKMRLTRWITLLFAVHFLAYLLGAATAPCSFREYIIPVDHRHSLALQRFVNRGHQPWRMDSQAVAASVLAHRRIVDKDVNPYKVTLITIRRDGPRERIYAYHARNDRTYRITVMRFPWLLPEAQKWNWMIWNPVKLTAITCRPKR